MPEELGYLAMNVKATAVRPLLGLTVLVVEDSRFASEALRLLCIRSGARIRRADSLGAAHRHLKVYRPAVVIVDLGLPDGSGIELIEEFAQQDPGQRPVLLACSGADGEGLEDAALAAGADDFLPKPIASVSVFQQAILAHLPADMQPSGPRVLSDDAVEPDTLALNEDLSHIDALLQSGADTLPYVAPFLQGLARLSGDEALKTASARLTRAFAQERGLPAAIEKVRDVIRTRLRTAELV
ncbi:MAG: response regulator [Litoreibacter sp.]|nr:response regulator [Litoreibacter sp.]